MDSILEDSVDKNSPDDNLIDTLSEMFTDEHALDYSSPPLWDNYDDELFDLETVNDNTYDDPFDSKEEKIKNSKILIDELDSPGLSIFLPPFLECDLVFYKYFSEVDALPSTNNEDKVFNPGILIHENHFEVTNRATPKKNVKKTTNASLILEDFNPPLYELPFHKKVPGIARILKPLETDIRQKDEKSSQNDKTKHGMEERKKSQSQSQTREVKVKADAENEEILNGPTHLGLQDEWKAEINFAILLTPKAHLSKPLSEEAHMKTKT
ncbi:hypothetical protein Tco_0677892 [Tanacetum coccineum]|uniref:Uncharacterized protein n=1 Tax=Tanacetum coccineum TaxID=301880 RepID=A0ABQ4XDJ8_9ASTR